MKSLDFSYFFVRSDFKFLIKRQMFTKINNLKKSGDITIITPVKSDSIIKENIIAPIVQYPNLNSSNLDFVNNIGKQKSLNALKVISTLKVGIGVWNVQPTMVNRELAHIAKVKTDFTVIELRDCIAESPYKIHIQNRMEEADNTYKAKEMDYMQWTVYLKRIASLNMAYTHSMIIDIIEESDESVTIIYHVITTKKKIVDCGGSNEFEPIYLCSNEKEKNFYTIPLTYKQKLTKNDYNNYFITKQEHLKDTIDFQRKLTFSLKQVANLNTFKLFDVNKDCLDLVPSKIDPNQIFENSPYNEKITESLSQNPEV